MNNRLMTDSPYAIIVSLLCLLPLSLMTVVPLIHWFYRRAILARQSKVYLVLDGNNVCRQAWDGRIIIRRMDGVFIFGLSVFATFTTIGQVLRLFIPGASDGMLGWFIIPIVLWPYIINAVWQPMIVLDPAARTVAVWRLSRIASATNFDQVAEIVSSAAPLPSSKKYLFGLSLTLNRGKTIPLGQFTGKDTPENRRCIEEFQGVIAEVLPHATLVSSPLLAPGFAQA